MIRRAFAATLLLAPLAAFAADVKTTPESDTAPAVQALGALNSVCTVTLAGKHGAGFLLAAGTLVGTIVSEVSYDGGTTFTTTAFDEQNTNDKRTSKVFATSNAQYTATVVMAAGASHARVRVSAWTSGTANCSIRASMANDPSVLFSGPVATATQPITVAQVGGWDGAALRTLKTDTLGGVVLAQRATYTAGTTAKTATAAGTGPWFSMCGSATKTVRLQQFVASCSVATAAVYCDYELTKTSAATSAGTAVALTKVPHDSNSAASTLSLINYYTALATAGTAVGKVGSQQSFCPLAGTAATYPGSVIFNWTIRSESEAPVLRGTAQCIEASFGTTTTNAPTCTAQATWTEE